MADAKVVLTKPGSHVAIAKGYAHGHIIEVGEPVPAGIPVTDPEGAGHWMAEAGSAPAAPAEE
jgi:hypothetical protein